MKLGIASMLSVTWHHQHVDGQLQAPTLVGWGPFAIFTTATFYLSGHPDNYIPANHCGISPRRFWQDQFLARQYSHDGGGEPTVGIDYDGRVFQVLGGQPGTPFGIGCWGTNTSTGYVQVGATTGLCPRCRKSLQELR